MVGIKILVVDDEDVVRNVYVRLLEHSGYEVFAAASVQEALGIFESEPELDVILTDYHLGTATADNLIAAVRKQSALVHIIVMSGGMTEEEQNRVRENVFGFLSKPFAFKDLQGILISATVSRF